MENFKSIHNYCSDLKLNYPKLSDYEQLTLAVQMQRNDILKAGLNVAQGDSYPSALEAIAIQLGMSEKGGRILPGTIPYELSDIKEAIATIANKE